MLCSDILNEAVEIRELIEQVSHEVPIALKNFVEEKANEWSRAVTYDRRAQLGYDRYSDTPEEWMKKNRQYKPPNDFKSFDQDDFDAANERADWTPHEEIIERQLEQKLIPATGSSPVYAAMGVISKVLTRILQAYLLNKFGDPIRLVQGTLEAPVSRIKVQVWWKATGEHKYGGIYRSRSAHANGEETRLEVIVDRNHWRHWLIEAVTGYLTGEGYIFDEFTENIMNTFAHEYAHLEQDIKGQHKYEFSLIPQKHADGKTNRHSKGAYDDPDDREKMLLYFARPAEIDAFATGAAALAIDRIIRRFATGAHRHYQPNWTIRNVSDEYWNDEITYALNDWESVIGGEYIDYVRQINDRLSSVVPTTIKAKYLSKVKQRFLKTFYARMMSYRR